MLFPHIYSPTASHRRHRHSTKTRQISKAVLQQVHARYAEHFLIQLHRLPGLHERCTCMHASSSMHRVRQLGHKALGSRWWPTTLCCSLPPLSRERLDLAALSTVLSMPARGTLPVQQLLEQLQECAQACKGPPSAPAPVKLHSAAASLSQKRAALHKEFAKASGARQTLPLPEWVSLRMPQPCILSCCQL